MVLDETSMGNPMLHQTTQNVRIFGQAFPGRTQSIDEGVSETAPRAQPDFLFGPGGGDYVGTNSYDAG